MHPHASGFSLILAAVLILTSLGFAGAQELAHWTFADGAQGWTPTNQARVSEVSRRPGTKSLAIRQSTDEEQDSAWLSPVLPGPGHPLRVTCWVADNYTVQNDFSYAAAIELLPCDAQGQLTSAGGNWRHFPWDDTRKQSQYWGPLTTAGLLWKFYSMDFHPAPGHFRLRFTWPKALARGECYLTDVRVALAPSEPRPPAPAGTPRADSRYALEISTPANANLFYADDPLRLEFLLYPLDGKPIETFTQPVIEYEITDYEYFYVASGTIPFTEAAEVAVGVKDPKRDRSVNLHKSVVLTDPAARQVGREFFLHARLVDGKRVIAEDTLTYGVVNPRRTDPRDYQRCRFIGFSSGGGFQSTESAHPEQSLRDKMGVSVVHDWDYHGWRTAQPNAGDPIKPAVRSAFPKVVYCPNLEQMRGRKPGHPWGDISTMAPSWATFDDPFRPGCKTFDIDGYVAYIVAYVRTNREAVLSVVPSGLERTVDARTLELQRKAYTALKREFPDLPVGMMIYGLTDPRGVDLVLKEKLYEVADFFDDHMYVSAIDWTQVNRLRAELQKLGLDRPLISTEFSRVGGTDQLQRARDTITSMLDAHAHGMYQVNYYNMYLGNPGEPPLRDPILRGSFPGDGFAWMQYVDRPRVSAAISGTSWGRGSYGGDERGASLMPMLQCLAFYNFVQAVEVADFKTTFKPTPTSVAYVYAREGQTIMYLVLSEPTAPATLALTGDVPYTLQDLFGRTDRVTPTSASLVVATLDPLQLRFDREVPALYDPATAGSVLKPVSGGINTPVLARGATGTVEVILPPVFARAFQATVTATVDGRWPKTEPRTVQCSPQEPVSVSLPVTVAQDTPPGSYTFTTRLLEGNKQVSVLKTPLQISEILELELGSVPLTRRQAPAITATVRNLASQPMSGTIQLDNRHFGEDSLPTEMVQPYRVAARGQVTVSFPVPTGQVNLASSYTISATLRDAGGFTLTREDDISFQACEKATGPIKIDGDLGDWDLPSLHPIPFERWFNRDKAGELEGVFYSRWDANKLYFAAVIHDPISVVTGEEQVDWTDDNIMLGLYPWGWHMGEPLNTGYYREHLGPLAGGGASFLRIGHVPSGPSTPEGAEIAVKRTDQGYVYEWAYPRASVYPLRLEKGGRFRLSLTLIDQHQVPKVNWGEFSWLVFSGFNVNVDAQPSKWRQFELID